MPCNLPEERRLKVGVTLLWGKGREGNGVNMEVCRLCKRCGWTSYFLLLFLRWVLREGSIELVTGGDLTFIWE